MENFFIDKLRNIKLTKGQKQLAEYFVENQSLICQKSLLDIARDVGVSDVSVLRFVRAIGYDGYTELKHDLYAHISKEADMNFNILSLSDRMDRNAVTYKERNIEEVFLSVIHKNIEKSLRQNNPEKYNGIVELLEKSKRKAIVGSRGCQGVAIHFARSLRFLVDDVFEYTHSDTDALVMLQGLRKGDLLIMICFARYYKIDVQVLEAVKNQGVKICVITDKIVSPISVYSDILLLVETENISFNNSTLGVGCICEYLINLLCIRNETVYKKRLDKYDFDSRLFR